MKLLNTYEDADHAKACEQQISGARRLASERDDNQVIFNLFGIPTWSNFFRLDMYRLSELKCLLANRQSWTELEQRLHAVIIQSLHAVSKNYDLPIPQHWL